MTTSYQVETHNVAISDALLKIAAENGWTGFPESGSWRRWVVISKQSPNGGYSSIEQQGYKTVTIPEFIALLKKREDLPIMINGCEVDIRDNGIIVPCAFIDTATVDEIYARLHAND